MASVCAPNTLIHSTVGSEWVASLCASYQVAVTSPPLACPAHVRSLLLHAVDYRHVPSWPTSQARTQTAGMSQSHGKMQSGAFIYFTTVTTGKTFKRNYVCVGKVAFSGKQGKWPWYLPGPSNLLQRIVRRALGLARAEEESASDKGHEESL